ncbi:MAG: HIT family protein [Vallitaleaceae bacterium]|jgi:diadenosine tetraphosphate (Ap4A) HIT family hydrolase|nr:HIT family protein [Vallitaleaceae bacterium]
MKKDISCGYCMEGDLLAGFGIKICDLESSTLVLFKEQSHKGRVIVAYKDHVGDMTELSDSQRNLFFDDVNRVAKALHSAFKPDKINYGAYGDTGRHMHFHLVPKYKEDFEWTKVFEMNPDQVYLSDEQYNEIIELIKEKL